MNRREEATVLELWSRWFQGKPRSNQSYVDFYFDVIQPHQTLGRINAFEILDVLVNAESQQAPMPAQSEAAAGSVETAATTAAETAVETDAETA